MTNKVCLRCLGYMHNQYIKERSSELKNGKSSVIAGCEECLDYIAKTDYTRDASEKTSDDLSYRVYECEMKKSVCEVKRLEVSQDEDISEEKTYLKKVNESGYTSLQRLSELASKSTVQIPLTTRTIVRSKS